MNLKILDKLAWRWIERKTSATSSVFASQAGQRQFSRKNYDKLALEGYVKNVIGYASIRMIACQAAAVPLILKDGDKLIEDHALLRLLKRPNPMQSFSEFFEQAYSFILMNGNSYIEAVFANQKPAPQKGEPALLRNLRPSRISITPADNRMPANYIFEFGGRKVTFGVTTMGVSNILHLKLFNPIDDWFGMSPINAASWSIDQHNASSRWNLNILGNSSKPSGFLLQKSEENVITDTQRKALKEELELKHSGPENVERPMVVEGGFEFKEGAMKAKDIDFLNGKKMSAHDIALAFGVPIDLINTQQAKFDNIQASNQQLWENTILPLMEHFVNELNNWLVPRYGNENLKLEINEDKILPLTQRKLRRSQALESISHMTINEKRKLSGLPSLEGGDQLLVAFGQIPLDQVAEASLISSMPAAKSLTDIAVERMLADGFDKDTSNNLVDIMFKKKVS